MLVRRLGGTFRQELPELVANAQQGRMALVEARIDDADLDAAGTAGKARLPFYERAAEAALGRTGSVPLHGHGATAAVLAARAEAIGRIHMIEREAPVGDEVEKLVARGNGIHSCR